MVPRYALLCVLITVFSLVAAAAAYQVSPVSYSAACAFKVAFPATSIQGTDSLALEKAQAQSEVSRAAEGDLYTPVATAVGLSAATLSKNTQVAPTAGGSDFVVTVSDSRADRSASAANRLCDAFVAHLIDDVNSQRQDEINQERTQIDALLQSIDAIQAVPAAARSASDNAFLQAQQSALKADQQVLAVTLSLAPDDIGVVTRSSGGILADTRSLSRNLLVGAVAALLASFLLVLVVEMIRDLRSPSRGR